MKFLINFLSIGYPGPFQSCLPQASTTNISGMTVHILTLPKQSAIHSCNTYLSAISIYDLYTCIRVSKISLKLAKISSTFSLTADGVHRAEWWATRREWFGPCCPFNTSRPFFVLILPPILPISISSIARHSVD